MRQRILGLLASVGIGVALVVIPSGPASAHGVTQGDDYAVHNYDGTWFRICDAEDDSHKVWAGYYTSGSNSYLTAPVKYPSNPAGTNCTDYTSQGYILTNLRVVEDNPGSSDNYYGAWHGYPVAGN